MTTAQMAMRTPIKVHVFTDMQDVLFLKQSPGQKPSAGSISFTFGLDIDEDADVLIVYNRASYTIETSLPRGRTVFLAAEPDVIHPYSCRFLNQFGLVLSTTSIELNTNKWQRATCWHWYAGRDFSTPPSQPASRDHDWFSALEPPKKSDKISIVTSTKVHTEYHRKRLRFVEAMIEKIPQCEAKQRKPLLIAPDDAGFQNATLSLTPPSRQRVSDRFSNLKIIAKQIKIARIESLDAPL
ncbi:MAG: hypothetical protein HRU33_15815 [Rhodobacteraceae bacterium]|nr:hypothetical protein [Paracoccaceae bacterium]